MACSRCNKKLRGRGTRNNSTETFVWNSAKNKQEKRRSVNAREESSRKLSN